MLRGLEVGSNPEDQRPHPSSPTHEKLGARHVKDRFFSGKFDPERLEQAINSYAQEGWGVISMATASIHSGLGQNREELVVLLERQGA